MTEFPASPKALSASGAPIHLAAQGHFRVGGERLQTDAGLVASAPMYVEYHIPVEVTQPFPVVLVHGGGGQGSYWMTTPDGRPGWVPWLLRQGYAVYVVDRPGHGRSVFLPETMGPLPPATTYEWVLDLFVGPEKAAAYPQASRHTQWPGGPVIGDPALDEFMASFGPTRVDLAESHRDMQRCGAALLDRIGPAILVTHSAGGPFGWIAADARPDLVKAIVAVEPYAAPFTDGPPGYLAWGLTAIPVSFDPPVADASELVTEVRVQPNPERKDCLVQAEPVRRLPKLAEIPIAVVVAEASWMALDSHGVVDFLVQAGAPAELLRLEESGIHGNGHMPMSERNSDDVVALLHAWITDHVDRSTA
jgi:pimeloyl-ACP methyl ester carboxylesterase